MNDPIKAAERQLVPLEGTVMLGPMDLEGWLDGNEDEDLCARLRQTPQIQMLDRDASVACFPGWSAFDFSLARRFCETNYLDTHELHKLADRLGL